MVSRFANSSNSLCVGLDLIVVDDDEMILEVVNRILRKTNTSYSLFDSPDTVISLLTNMSHMPRIMVVDYYMPSMTGIDFFARLDEQVDLRQSSVFLCSSTDPRHEKSELLSRLGVQLIDKAVIFDRDALLGLVGSVPDAMGN